MTYKAADIEGFDETPSEDLWVNGDDAAGPEEPIVEESGEVLLPKEVEAEPEPAPEPEPPNDDEATGEPPAPESTKAAKPASNEQINAILRLAEKTWTDRATATESFKTWLGQMFEGVQGVRQLNYQQACKCIAVLQKNLTRAA